MIDQSSLLLREAQRVGHNRAHTGSRKLIEAAIALIELRHSVDQDSTYVLLVQRSMDGQRSVRAAAIGTLADLPG